MNSKNKLAEMPIRPLLYTMAVPLMLSDRADPELLARLESIYHGAPAHADLALLLTTSGIAAPQ